MKDFIKKIQNLPEPKRKIILWATITIIGLGLFAVYIKNIQKKLSSFEAGKIKEELQIPFLEEKLKELPKFEMPKIELPEISEEKLREVEKMMEATEETKLPE